uniref:RRM domain-containing protein n=1 Tax=Eptatretus burgeri TaxID=7764 RepID=A0A8C4PWX4_EPTBU
LSSSRTGTGSATPHYPLRHLVLRFPVARYAFVEFEDSRDASDAVSHLHGRELMGVRAIVEHARTPQPRGSSPPRWSLGGCQGATDKYPLGAICDTRPREGVVEYRKYSDVKRALATLQGTRLYGKRIYLTLERRARRGSGTPSQSRWEFLPKSFVTFPCPSHFRTELLSSSKTISHSPCTALTPPHPRNTSGYGFPSTPTSC